ncbi:MAG: PIN domain-containing protein [Candidatus Freyarchaeota archaeon]
MRVLLDTSFLLPVFGVNVDIPNIRVQLLSLSRKADLLVNSLSVLEAKWIILKLSRKEPDLLKAFGDGLNLLVRGKQFEIIPFYLPEVDAVATAIYNYHRDYIDCSILASAYVEANTLVTLEKKKMEELAGLIHPELSVYRKISSKLTVATLSETVKDMNI